MIKIEVFSTTAKALGKLPVAALHPWPLIEIDLA
jgi:hypothetical protein